MEPWEQVARTVLELLAHRQITPERAESWLWMLLEYAEQVS